MTSADETNAAAADELKVGGGRLLLILFQTIPVPIIVSIAVFYIYSYNGPLYELSCSFEANQRLLSLWPANLRYIGQLKSSDFTPVNRCWFFAVTSTVSLFYLLWLCWVVCHCVFVLKRIRHGPGTAKLILPKIFGMGVVAAVSLGVSAGLMLAISFGPGQGWSGLSTLSPIGWSASKVVFFIIPYSYFAAGFTVIMLLHFVRYVIYQFREG